MLRGIFSLCKYLLTFGYIRRPGTRILPKLADGFFCLKIVSLTGGLVNTKIIICRFPSRLFHGINDQPEFADNIPIFLALVGNQAGRAILDAVF